MAGKIQLELDFEPGLTQQFPTLRDMMAAVIYGSRSGLNGCAAVIDKSPSHLSRILSRNDPDDVRHFDIDWIPPIIDETKDRRPISWLIERFMEDPAIKRKQVVDKVAVLLPLLEKMVREA